MYVGVRNCRPIQLGNRRLVQFAEPPAEIGKPNTATDVGSLYGGRGYSDTSQIGGKDNQVGLWSRWRLTCPRPRAIKENTHYLLRYAGSLMKIVAVSQNFATIMCARNAEMDLSNIMSPSPGADCHPDIIDRTWGLKKGGAYFRDDTVIQYSITIMHISRPKKLKASSVVDRLLVKSQSSYMNYRYTYTLIFLK